MGAVMPGLELCAFLLLRISAGPDSGAAGDNSTQEKEQSRIGGNVQIEVGDTMHDQTCASSQCA
jgi:hypothetical protein